MKYKFEYEPNKISLAYLLGIYLTDGHVGVNQDYRYRLRVVDQDIAEAFVDASLDLLGYRPTITMHDPSPNGQGKRTFYEACIYKVEFGRWLVSVTNAKKSIPSLVYQESEAWQKEFIAGLLDGDGWASVSQRRANNNPTRSLSWQGSIGLCGELGMYINGVRTLFDKLGIDYSYGDRPSVGAGKTPMRSYNIKISSFLAHNLYFRCKRKQDRVEIIRQNQVGQKYNTKPLSEVQRVEV